MPTTNATVFPRSRSDTLPSQKASHSFCYRGWRVRVELSGTVCESRAVGHADLYDTHLRRCRLTLVPGSMDGASAVVSLASNARAFIDHDLAKAAHDD